jgi:hypothetical protein
MARIIVQHRVPLPGLWAPNHFFSARVSAAVGVIVLGERESEATEGWWLFFLHGACLFFSSFQMTCNKCPKKMGNKLIIFICFIFKRPEKIISNHDCGHSSPLQFFNRT